MGLVQKKHIANLAGNKNLVLPMPAFNVINGGSHAGNKLAMQENKEGLELLKTTIAKAGYTGKVVIGMDVATSEFYNDKDKTYDLNFKGENNDGSQKISGDSLANVYKSFVADYPIISIEDPFDQDDWTTYAKMTTEMGQQVQIVGDDLLVTNPTLKSNVQAWFHVLISLPLLPKSLLSLTLDMAACALGASA